MAETEIIPLGYEHEEFEGFDGPAVYGEGFTDEYPAPSAPSMSTTWLVSICLLMVGNVMLVLVNGEVGPAALAAVFLTAGLIIHLLPGFRDPYARRAFVLSFCTYVFITGLAQCYTYFVFGVPHIFIDATNFHRMSQAGMGGSFYAAWETIGPVSVSPLPVFIWRVLYTIVSPLGDGQWVGIMLNCFLVAMAASITVKAGRHIFGNNPHKLRRLGTLFVCCGMFWLFACLHLRDSFALLLNVITLWACVRVLTSPSFMNLIITVIVIFVSALAMLYVRDGLWPLFVLFAVIAFFSWTRRITLSGISFVLPIGLFFFGLLLLPVISAYTGQVALYVGESAVAYGAGAYAEGSLGALLVINQPMPIRVPVGAVYLLVYPVPFWTGFRLHFGVYHWIKSFHAIFLIVVVPSALVGLGLSIKRAVSGGIRASVPSFLATYVIVTLMAVSATTIETRHYAQFLPGFLLLAVFPDKSDPLVRRKIRLVAVGWLALIFMGHILWMAIKFF